MKKTYTALLLAFVTVFSPISAYAAQTGTTAETTTVSQTDLTESYSTLISSVYDDELETLTYEEAEEKTLRNNSTLKNLSASMKLAESNLDLSYTETSADSGTDFSNLISFLNSKASYENSELSKVAQEESIKHSLKESYINMIKTQREIALGELQLETDKMNLDISKTKLKAGKISQSEYDNLELSYNTEKEQLETKKENLELNYVSLNILMGTDVSKRYNFVMPAVYEPFELDIPVESYINAKTAESNSVIQAKKSYENTKQTSKLTSITSSAVNGYQSVQNSLNSAEMSYEDTKDKVYESLYNKYNSIVENEKNYASALEELKLLQSDFIRTQVKYLNGKVSQYELISAQYKLAEKENSLLNSVYEHMLLKEELTNTDLM